MWHDRNGPRPPSRRRVENQLQQHVRRLTVPSPRCLDPHHRSGFAPLLMAHRDWRLASHPPGRQAPVDQAQEIETLGAESRASGHVGLRLVVALTSLGDLGTIFAAVSAVVTMPLPVTALLVLAMAAAALFVAHEIGRELRLRRLGAARMPAVLVTLLAAVWLAVGLLAALLRLAAPLTSPGGVDVSGASDAAAVSVLLTGLLPILYAGSGLAAATLGFLTGDPDGERAASLDVAARLRVHTDRRHQVATARIDAYFRVLAADTALTLAATTHDPATTDALTAFLNEE